MSNDSQASTSASTTTQRSPLCQVCGVQTNSLHLNYGGAACLSCRAFFRRKVKKKDKAQLICKESDKCHITEQNRTSCCRKCRFEKCIKAGMSTQAVLSEEQIQVIKEEVMCIQYLDNNLGILCMHYSNT